MIYFDVRLEIRVAVSSVDFLSFGRLLQNAELAASRIYVLPSTSSCFQSAIALDKEELIKL